MSDHIQPAPTRETGEYVVIEASRGSQWVWSAISEPMSKEEAEEHMDELKDEAAMEGQLRWLRVVPIIEPTHKELP